ncbi:3-deoxy-7-phosphoheptulonate synthase [Massilia sp. W12]|uniref:3-deoxy-7-phosphoheptulonate synthase n=1 Tax=Massilia sp. W12 TaxID=3126507 RepID=UPI0030D00B35
MMLAADTFPQQENGLRLPAPAQLRAQLPLTAAQARKIASQRQTVRRIVHGADHRLLVVTGPCSLHDGAAAQEYARRLLRLQAEVADQLYLVMRAYCEKPRSCLGWKGLLHQDLQAAPASLQEQACAGLHASRQLLLQLSSIGLPLAVECLDPVAAHYFTDLPAWGAIGARTTESQTHRELASALPYAIGFKNASNGAFDSAVAGIAAAAAAHSRFGLDEQGHAAVLSTPGNPDGHLILRGGALGPNYDAQNVRAACRAQEAARLYGRRLIVDCSHGNCNKQHQQQITVALELGRRIAAGEEGIGGLMLESFLEGGRCDWQGGAAQPFGCSITDPCLSWDDTRALLLMLAAELRAAGWRGAAPEQEP